MPSERRGTVTEDIAGYIQRLQGTMEWRADRAGNIRAPIAKVCSKSFILSYGINFICRCTSPPRTFWLISANLSSRSKGRLVTLETQTTLIVSSRVLEAEDPVCPFCPVCGRFTNCVSSYPYNDDHAELSTRPWNPDIRLVSRAWSLEIKCVMVTKSNTRPINSYRDK